MQQPGAASVAPLGPLLELQTKTSCTTNKSLLALALGPLFVRTLRPYLPTYTASSPLGRLLALTAALCAQLLPLLLLVLLRLLQCL